MIKKHCDIVVVGGGPAGIAAGTTAAEHGAAVIVVDDSNTLGGNYFKEMPGNFEGIHHKRDRKNIQELHQRITKLKEHSAEILDQSRIWGIFPGSKLQFQVCIDHAVHHLVSLDAQAIVLATGVYDRPIPFPGWELPGVLTPGAVQMMLKKQGLLPGRKILVAGTGPLQIVVAAALTEAGADVVALLDTSGALDGMKALPGALGSLSSRFGEISHSLRVLLRKRVPLFFRHAVFKALGEPSSGVEKAIIGRITPEGHPIPGTERTLNVDTICCAYGFVPSIALTQHLGCKHVFDSTFGAYLPWHDEFMQSSQSRVYLAGDVTGVGGKSLADLQGKIAGISVAEQLGYISMEQANLQRKSLKTAIRREERFARWLWNRYPIRQGLLDVIDEDTVICRCENVTAGMLKQGLELGARDLKGIKLRTRLGMGSCQGRYCMVNSVLLISQKTGIPPEELSFPSVRPPVAPVRLKNISTRH